MFRVLLTILLWGSFSIGANAKEVETIVEKKYPPYPEVWGYDISGYPAVMDNRSHIMSYTTPDGDIVFIFASDTWYAEEEKNGDTGVLLNKTKYTALKFFEGKIIDIGTYSDKNQFDKNHNFKFVSKDMLINFKDGSFLRQYVETAGRLCPFDQLDRNILLKGSAGQEKLGKWDDGIEKFSILGAMPTIARGAATTRGIDPCPRGAELVYRQLYFFHERIMLEDDTFITYNSNGNLIIRFDKDLNTKFKPRHKIMLAGGAMIDRNFFVIPYSLIERIKGEVYLKEEYGEQGLHDDLLMYFYKEQARGVQEEKILQQ